ncbi:hypothetical protein M2262_001803 [Pseudomonas sp. BIGb0408]|uniref:DUF2798 domain-containing protein n=1 Tax=Phytopseudomonas flavescens TaxID=29435 RepID=A0A7Y9XLN6_9GAMM|nr:MULTISPECIES: DUF2798 domain-containing protein [Pseudomonas]MCW2291753.1 hypothetical protein [Pseudomonas sp. BIGb0408]NYH73676.1 hypothetical protein [Pseudomonas flavescens]
MPDTTLSRTRRSWKLPARLSSVAFAFFMSGIMAFLMCLVITATNRGLSDGYLGAVLEAYQLAMPVAFVCVMGVRPVVLHLVRLTVRAS